MKHKAFINNVVTQIADTTDIENKTIIDSEWTKSSLLEGFAPKLLEQIDSFISDENTSSTDIIILANDALQCMSTFSGNITNHNV